MTYQPGHASLKRWISIILATACLLVVSGCSKPEAAPEAVVDVQATGVRVGDLTESITADAVLSPLSQAAIASKITAPVRKFYVQRGSKVHAGQLLATLENRDLRAAALDTQGTYTAAKAAYQTTTEAQVPEDYTRAKLDVAQTKANLDLNQQIVNSRQQLFAQGAIPGRDLDTATAALVQARAAYDTAVQHFQAMTSVSRQAALTAAKGQLVSAEGKYLGAAATESYAEIRSPIKGVVTDRPLFAGETAAAGAPLVTVMDSSALLAKLHLPQAQVQLLSLGAPATISVPGMEASRPAKVSLISPALDPGSTTVEVWLRVENPDGKLKVGTPVHTTVAGRTASHALIVPLAALLIAQDGSKSLMKVGSDSVAHKQAVNTGIQAAGQVQIVSGVKANEEIVTTGAYALEDGTKVRVTTPGAPGGGDSGSAESEGITNEGAAG
jgi:HlyD family secretion protein